MARDVSDNAPVPSRHALIEWFEQGCKPVGQFRLGTEHEKFPFYLNDLSPVPYETVAGRTGGIRALLEGMQERTGWSAIHDHGAIIGLFDEAKGGAISLEPGGQFELSGAPLANIHDTAQELKQHLTDANAIAHDLGIGFLGLGMSPVWSLEQTPIMPKQRYQIMRDYMPKVGQYGRDMMFRTCTVQANLDYGSEADMVQKLRVSLSLQPLVTALFANSPFTDSKPNGFLSMRSQIWRDTDNQRAGMLPFAFEEGMGFQRYVDYALDVPMYFVLRDGTYHNVAGASFRDLMAGTLSTLPGVKATMSDWANHLGTIFPEVRLKRYLEMRGADAGCPAMLNALPALFTGLLYDSQSLDETGQLLKSWTNAEREALRRDVPRLGLEATIGGRSLGEIGRDVLKLAHAGLQRRARLNAKGQDETMYLAPLDQLLASGRTQAQDLLDLWSGEWKQDMARVFSRNRM